MVWYLSSPAVYRENKHLYHGSGLALLHEDMRLCYLSMTDRDTNWCVTGELV